MKRILKLLSIVMSLVILTAAAVVPIWSEEADYEPKTYQHVKKLATLSLDERLFAYSEELFAIDNVIYDGNGKKVTLTYPDGMISWLSAQSSDYGAGQNDSDSGSFLDEIREFIRNTFNKFVSAVKNAVISISI